MAVAAVRGTRTAGDPGGGRYRPRVLVVDDDASLRGLLDLGLSGEGFDVDLAESGRVALRRLKAQAPDAVVLDILMPGMDGIETCRRIRRVSHVPVIMLTAKRSEGDIVHGLEAGADDYVTKPFSVRTLAARVRSALRRVQIDARAIPAGEKSLSFDGGRLVLDVAKRQVELAGKPIDLSRTEFRLLHLLMTNAGRVVPHDDIVEYLWQENTPGQHSKLRTYMGLLRRKLGERGRRGGYLYSHHGIGYRFDASG